MPLVKDLHATFEKAAPGIEAEGLKAELALQLAEYIEAINKALAASGITLRVRVRTAEDEHHIFFTQFNREEAYAKVKLDPKKDVASLTPEGKRTERLSFDDFAKRLLADVVARLDADEQMRFGKGFRAFIAQLEKPKELTGPV